jgi:3-oxoacyl-[acyl-carrier-protein] synthase-3
VVERRVAAPGETTADLACVASRRALDAAGLSVDDVDLILLATITPDTCCPSGANWLQAKLDAPRAVAFDITAACSGFVFAMNVAEQYLASGAADTVLVAAAEVMTRTLDYTDRNTCILWGDGAGAAILAMGDDGPEILATRIHSDGKAGEHLLLPGGGSKTTPIDHASVDEGRHALNMIEANATFRVAVRHFVSAIEEGTEAAGVAIDEVRWFIPHQANERMFRSVAKSLQIPFERFYLTLSRYGNVSSASCAISLDEAVRDGSIAFGDYVCLPVFGGGLTWGSAMLRW